MKTMEEKLILELHELEMEKIKLECDIEETVILGFKCVAVVSVLTLLTLITLLF